MAKREEQRKNSLDVLARIARGSGGPPIKPRKEPEAAERKAQPQPKPEPQPATRPKGAPLEGKAAERAERELWRRRREAEVQRAQGIRRPPPPPTPAEQEQIDKSRAARARAESRRARQESLRDLAAQRQRDLHRGQNMGEVRGPWMRPMDADPKRGRMIRGPPSLEEKMGTVLGEAASSRDAWAKRQQEKRERAGNQRQRRGRGS